MRAIIQRVKKAEVSVDQITIGKINTGLLVFLGIGANDCENDIKYIADKMLNLRIFTDSDDKMNLSLCDIGGEILIVSQFTLYGDCRKGRRPNFSSSCEPKLAEKLYLDFLEYCKNSGFTPAHGEFGADMQVTLVNDGPVTIMLDSEKLF